MLSFYKQEDINKSKNELISDFEESCDEHIYKKSDNKNLMITSYNMHFFSPAIIDKLFDEKIAQGIQNLLKFCSETNSDILILQEALFNPEIIAIFKNYDYIPYVCNTYKLDKYYFGNMILIKNDITIKKFSKELYISGYKEHKKCIVNVVIEYQNMMISIYNIHLDVWDRTGKCRLEQIEKLIKKVEIDTCPNIILVGDFNSIKKSDYSENEINALKKLYEKYTKNPFKEIQFLIRKGFKDVASEYFKEKIIPTVWSKQRVDFFFVNEGFKFDILQYHTHTISGSDHFPISIELFKQNDCFKLPKNINQIRYSLLDNYKKLIYEFNYLNCKYILKILPIWNKYWKDSQEKLQDIGISESHINYGMKNAYHEYIITKYLSKLTKYNISYSLLPIISSNITTILPKDIRLVLPQLDKIPNQKYYFIIEPKLNECSISDPKNTDIILFQLQWGLFISYQLFKFIHGDILNGYNHNLLCYTYRLPGKNSLIVRYKRNIWRFPIMGGELPVVVLFDYGFSEFNYKNIHIHNKIPFIEMNKSTPEKKWELDIKGYNIFLNKIGIKRKIPNIHLSEYHKLLDRFETYKISIAEFRKIDKKKYLLFDGNKKKF
jgi:endonuclease/exonuclease/phosphatase family metal-dependent hydrolase